MSGPWLLVAALALATPLLWRAGRRAHSLLLPVVALLAAGAVLRALFGLWGPLHVNGQGALWIRGALEPSELASYGPGYPELFGWLVSRSDRPDLALFACNGVLSSTAPVLLVAVARAAGLSVGAALSAGLVLALDPISVRMGASEGYFIPIVSLTLFAQWLLLSALGAWARAERRSAAAGALAAGLVAATAARIHPCAYLPVALAPLVIAGATTLPTWRSRVAACASLSLVVAAVVGASSGGVLSSVVPSALAHGGPHRPSFVAPLAAVPVTAALVGVGWLGRHRLRAPWLSLGGLACLAAMWATRHVYDQHPFWQLSYDRLFWAPIVLAAAAFLPHSLERSTRSVPFAIGAASAGLWLTPASTYVETTEQLEYRFLSDALRSASPDCVVASLTRHGRRLVYLPDYLLAAARADDLRLLRVESPADLSSFRLPGACLLYARTSLCASAEARPICEAIEVEVPLELVASRRLPARPSHADLPYDREVVETALFRVSAAAPRPVEPVVSAPGSPERSCSVIVTAAQVREVFSRLAPLRESDGCVLDGLETNRAQMAARFRALDGMLYEARIAPATCAERSADVVGWFAVRSPDALERQCPRTVEAAKRALADPPGIR